MKENFITKAGLIILIGTLTLIISCSDKLLDPIFYTLEKEEEIIDYGLDNEITVQQVAKGGGNYFAAAGQIFYRSTGGTTWYKANHPQSGALCNTIAEFGGSLYAGFFNQNGKGLGLYRANPSSSLNWSPEPNGGVTGDGVQITMLKVVNSMLFVTILDDSEYSLRYYNVGFDPTIQIDQISLPITDITWDAEVTRLKYWVTAGSVLYGGAIDNIIPEDPQPTTETLGGVLYHTVNNNVYLSTRNGKLWSFNGISWSESDTYVEEDNVPFTEFAEVTSGSYSDLFVGTHGPYGYYWIKDGDITDVERSPDYNIDLYNAPVLRFLVDGSKKVFACTAGFGLWRSDDYTKRENIEWCWE